MPIFAKREVTQGLLLLVAELSGRAAPSHLVKSATGDRQMNLLPTQYQHLSQLMDVSELRQRVISHNLANVNTPGYKRLDVVFEEELAKQIQSGKESVENLQPQVLIEQGLPARADGNTVDVDREIGQLNRNSLQFQTYSQLLSAQFDMMRRAIR